MADDFISGALAGQSFKQNAETLREQPQLFELSMAEGQAKLATSQMDLKERQTALDNAKAIQQIQSKALRRLSLGQMDSTADPTQATTDALQTMGMAEIEGGFPVQGAELLKQSVTIAKDHAEIISKQSDTKIKKFSFAASGLSDVHDEASWREFKMLAQSEYKGALDPKIADRPYSPELIKMLQDGAQTQLQKAQTERDRASTRLSNVEARKDEAEIPLEKARTEAEEALAAQRRKNAGESGQPAKEDLAAAYAAVKGDFGKGADKEAATAAALPIAERTAQLVRQGVPRSSAVAKAYQEEKAKSGSRLQGLSKPTPIAEAGVGMIDDILGLLDKADASNIRITGVPGMARRIVKEDVGGTLGLTKETIANDFESKLTALQVELPALLLKSKSQGQFSKLKADKMATIARGLKPGDNYATTRSALLQIRETLSGEEDKGSSSSPPSKGSIGGAIPLEDYLRSQE